MIFCILGACSASRCTALERVEALPVNIVFLSWCALGRTRSTGVAALARFAMLDIANQMYVSRRFWFGICPLCASDLFVVCRNPSVVCVGLFVVCRDVFMVCFGGVLCEIWAD